LVATVTATRTRVRDPAALGPEHFSVLQLAQAPVTVVDIASDVDLPLGVVRILLADLRQLGLVTIQAPVSMRAASIDRSTLREVLHGLRGL
jgi:DNA-binding GntR family transcriptional regulator